MFPTPPAISFYIKANTSSNISSMAATIMSGRTPAGSIPTENSFTPESMVYPQPATSASATILLAHQNRSRTTSELAAEHKRIREHKSPMIVLESERLLFRAHEPGDLEAYCAMEADPEVRRYVGGAPRTREEAEHKFRSVHLKSASARLALRATIFKPEGLYIGYCGLYPNSGSARPTVREATLAFYLARAYWGIGLATEAGRAFIDFGFSRLHLARIVASAEVGNAASLRVVEKLGFSLTGTERGSRSFNHFELRNPEKEAR
jgi:[ribosomal protein S5]-alanine N-acetyltransferase